MPFLVGVTERGSHTKIACDRTLNVARRGGLALRAVVQLYTTFKLISGFTSNNIDGTLVGVSTKKCRLRALNHLNAFYLRDRQTVQTRRHN